MPRIPKKKGLIPSAQTFIRELAPRKLEKAKAIFKRAKEITPNDLRTLEGPSRDLLSRMRAKATFNQALATGALKISDLNKPISKLIKRKIKKLKK